MKQRVRFNIFVLLILLLFLVTVGVSTTQARYEKTMQAELTFQYQNEVGLVYLLSSEKDANGEYVTDTNGDFIPPGSWDVLEDGETGTDGGSDTGTTSVYQLSFLAANGKNVDIPCEQDQRVNLAVVATVGVVKPENLMIVLTDGQSSYTAIPFAITEGMADYETYGPGWMYRFYNEAGEELSWPLVGGVFQAREFTLTVTGQSETVAALRLNVYTSPGII